jgi:subtilisin family serine protease
MRASPLAFAILLSLSGTGLADSDVTMPTAKSVDRGTYIVTFAEPPLATFRGDTGAHPKLAGLKATSPAVTGERRLDLDKAESRAYRAVLAQLRGERLARASASFGRSLQPRFVYDVVNNGVALELTAAEAAELAKMDGVRQVEADYTRRPMTDAGPQWIHADQLWSGVAGVQTRGEGVVVGVVDSGINRIHPSFAAVGPVDAFAHSNPRSQLFGRCAVPATAIECNNKLIGIHDFTTGDGDNEPNTGADMTTHGTHVASTAAGNLLNVTLPVPGATAQTRQMSGVAPHANLIAYKACEEETTCNGSWLVAALNQATADGVDVINYSIGGSPRNPFTSSDSQAMLAAREAGIVVVVAAGNEGPGESTVTSPGDAPWVITAANATHDRALVNRLVDLSGGATAAPGGGVLVGVGSTAGIGPRPLVFDPAFPGCATGTALDDAQTGASNPWPAGRFNGEIVVCERGVQARVAKSNNVRLAGGGGMVLINLQADGESVVADAHSIPSTHLGFAAGQALKAWMASGTGHSGRLEGNRIENLPEMADVLSSSSGRGPVATLGILKPDLTAPGSNIVAASRIGSTTTFLSGTSMATPHISGASALLISAKPSWTPSQVESALLTSARASIQLPDGVTAATPLDAGAGATDVAKAVKAGLAFNITPAEFRAANPASGGVPRDLNRPSIAHDDCFRSCTATRRVTDMVGGASWRVEVDMPSPGSATVTPSEFTLAAGETKVLNFSFDVSDASFPGSWVNGKVRFIRTGGSAAADGQIPVALYANPGTLPTSIDLSGPGESGFADITFDSLVPLPQADFSATELVAPVRTEQVLVEDPTRDDRYDSFAAGSGTFFTLITVPAAGASTGTLKLYADTLESSAYDVDMVVGGDFNGNGQPEEEEMLCQSTTEFDLEHCELDIVPEAGETRYWVLVQNWDAGVQGDTDPAASDNVILETVLLSLDAAPAPKLVATGPGHTGANEAFKVRLAWDDPTLLPGERRVGFLRISASDDAPGQVGLVPFELKRTQPGENAPALLDPNSTRHMRLAGGAAQDRLYLDVPENASSLTVTTTGSGEVDLYLARAATPGSPVIAPAPARGEAAGTSIHAGATEAVTLTGATLAAGRWYITPVNAGTTAAEFDLTVSLQYDAARAQPRYGAWYNPARSGAGLFLFPANGAWGLAWYTYLQDGTPTWYLGVGPAPTANQGVWKVALERFNWDGSAATGENVGEAQLALIDANNFAFSWNLDGESGSEPMGFLDGGACPQLNGAPAALTGLWYHPAKSGFGYSVSAYPGLESNGAYFYDGQGIARWALGQTDSFGPATMNLSQRDGFCPLCAHKAPVATEIGTLTRSYDSASAGRIAVDLELKPPMQGLWSVDLPAVRISDALICP